MKRAHYHLAIWVITILLVAAAVAIVFSPGYWEYQQIRWRTELTPDQIEAGMTGMLGGVKAMEELLGHRNLTRKDFQAVSADHFRRLQKLGEFDENRIFLRMLYLNRLRDDPSGADLRQRLYEDITSDVAERIDDVSSTGESLRRFAYEYGHADQRFHDLLLQKIGSLEWLKISEKQAEIIKAEQAGAGQPATRPESNSQGGGKPESESEGRSR